MKYKSSLGSSEESLNFSDLLSKKDQELQSVLAKFGAFKIVRMPLILDGENAKGRARDTWKSLVKT